MIFLMLFLNVHNKHLLAILLIKLINPLLFKQRIFCLFLPYNTPTELSQSEKMQNFVYFTSGNNFLLNASSYLSFTETFFQQRRSSSNTIYCSSSSVFHKQTTKTHNNKTNTANSHHKYKHYSPWIILEILLTIWLFHNLTHNLSSW